MTRKEDRDFEGVSALGKIYHSITDKKSLGSFFLESALSIIDAESGFLYLAGREAKLWVEAQAGGASEPPALVAAEVDKVFQHGKPHRVTRFLFIPLIIRNSAMGIAVFIRSEIASAFQERELKLASDLTHQAGSALKNILLFEQTVEMERLAAIGQSMGMVLHEIKNIVQVATFADEWLRRGLETQDMKYLERGAQGMSKALREMNGFIYEILSLTKNYKISPQPVRLSALLEELRMDFDDKTANLRVKLEIETAPSLGEVECEKRSIYRAVLNLVKNAIEACDKEISWVKVCAAPLDADDYTITVSDNGQGMTEEVKAKIRQAFFSTKGERGTGLGVMIVERTLQVHHGKMTIESKLGEGTTFTLTLPKKIPRG